MFSDDNTVSVSVQAVDLFSTPPGESSRRRRRSGEPGAAVQYQLERVYDFVSSEAIVLCDSRGRALKGVGDRQLCSLLSSSVPTIFRGDTDSLLYRLKVMDIIRPEIDCSRISVLPITIPHPEKRLFVASVSESRFNQAGVYHASNGVRRILGVPLTPNRLAANRVTSSDRLAYDISKAMGLGYCDFFESPLAQDMKVPRRLFGPSRKDYHKALDIMLERVDRRLAREGLAVDRPNLRERYLNRGTVSYEGYRNYLYELPLRVGTTGKRVGTLNVQMAVYEKHFEIPVPPRTRLDLN